MSFESPNFQTPEDVPALTDRIQEIDMPILEIPETEQMRLDTERMQKEISTLINISSKEEAEVRFLATNAETRKIIKRAADIARMTAMGISVKKTA